MIEELHLAIERKHGLVGMLQGVPEQITEQDEHAFRILLTFIDKA